MDYKESANARKVLTKYVRSTVLPVPFVPSEMPSTANVCSHRDMYVMQAPHCLRLS